MSRLRLAIHPCGFAARKKTALFMSAVGFCPGVNVSTEPMGALVKGSVALATPDNDKVRNAVSDGMEPGDPHRKYRLVTARPGKIMIRKTNNIVIC